MNAPKFSALVFVPPFLDGALYPLIALPLFYCWAACPDGLKSLGIRRSGSWPIPKSATILLKDVLWYPVYEGVNYRGFFPSQLGGYFKHPGRQI